MLAYVGVLAGFGPASWSGKKFLEIDGQSRLTIAERLPDQSANTWNVRCFQSAEPCLQRAEFLCEGAAVMEGDAMPVSDIGVRIFHRGAYHDERGPTLEQVVTCEN